MQLFGKYLNWFKNQFPQFLVTFETLKTSSKFSSKWKETRTLKPQKTSIKSAELYHSAMLT